MSQHNENDFVVPTLFVLFNHPDGIPTEQVKNEIRNFISLNKDDLAPYQSRNKNEPRYFQIVGNMISHKNPRLFKCVDRVMNNTEGKPKNILILNKDGIDYVETLIVSINKENDDKIIAVDKFDQKIIDFATNDKGNKSLRDNRLAREIIEICNYKCQYAVIKGKNHQTFSTEDGKKYAEAHHLIPMKASKDFFPKNLDRASNLICLCPNCHAILHHGSKEAKKDILKTLYDNYISGLNEDGIFISFEKLLEKYY